jgi:hypothetical protein
MRSHQAMVDRDTTTLDISTVRLMWPRRMAAARRYAQAFSVRTVYMCAGSVARARRSVGSRNGLEPVSSSEGQVGIQGTRVCVCKRASTADDPTLALVCGSSNSCVAARLPAAGDCLQKRVIYSGIVHSHTTRAGKRGAFVVRK